ncbi:MAG: cysteine--tRNA ligase [Candidatus Ancillula sp.]|jgi:cysteinyl-tRNA synthetase|nr:cysteine--tRNA ligase [Candidatus Ancillula sp.]
MLDLIINSQSFTPKEEGKVGIYLCGATVQSSPHIGHLRTAVAFDVIRRWFIAKGYNVKFVQNVTDIDDKILRKSAEAGIDWRQHAKKYEKEFTKSYDSLNVLRPDSAPHATKYIGQQIKFIKEIIDNGYAYPGEVDGEFTGNVWFDTSAWKDYGELTHQQNADETEVSIEDMRPDKKSPRDFALWKTPNPEDPDSASWSSPWGKGRPGWHLECSCMSANELKGNFDIHGGGLDLRFPHHENELAQSKAAKEPTPSYWMHSAWVTAKGEKMSKSLGNGLSCETLLKQDVLNSYGLRFAFSTVQYKSMLEWTKETLESSITAGKRLRKALLDLSSNCENNCENQNLNSVDLEVSFPQFAEAMNDDFNVSKAMAAIWGALKKAGSQDYIVIRKALQVLGIDPLSDFWDTLFILEEKSKLPNKTLSEEQIKSINQQILERKEAKNSKDFALADRIRDSLQNKGIRLIDTKDGTTFEIAE